MSHRRHLIAIGLLLAATGGGCTTPRPTECEWQATRDALPQAEEPAQALTSPVVELTAVAEPVPAEPTAEPVVLPPPRVKPKPAPLPLLSSYTVASGDTLWSVAARPDIYGDPLLWPLLYQANRDQIKDPRTIFSGQQLAIPHNHTEGEREEARSKARKSDVFPADQLLRPPRP